MARRTTISDETTGGNVFADLGLPRPGQELLKADLRLQSYRVLNARQLAQAQAGEILGITHGRCRCCSATGLGTSRGND